VEFSQDKLIQIIAKRLGLLESTIKPGSSFKDDLGADSLDLVELSMELEDVFGVTVSDEDAVKFLTVQDVLNYLKGVVK
jgi:acyl carrier protein